MNKFIYPTLNNEFITELIENPPKIAEEYLKQFIFFDRDGRSITYKKWKFLHKDRYYKILRENLIQDDFYIVTVWEGYYSEMAFGFFCTAIFNFSDCWLPCHFEDHPTEELACSVHDGLVKNIHLLSNLFNDSSDR